MSSAVAEPFLGSARPKVDAAKETSGLTLVTYSGHPFRRSYGVSERFKIKRCLPSLAMCRSPLPLSNLLAVFPATLDTRAFRVMEDFTYMQGESLWTIAEEDYDHLEGFSLSMSMVDHEALPNFPEAARGLADPVFDFTLESPIAIQSDFSHTTSALYAESTESNQDHFSGWHSDELNNLTQVVDDVFDLQAACENDTGLMAASASNGADDDTLGTSHSPGDVDAYAESGAWPFDGLDINPGLITSEKPWQCFGSEDVDQIFTRPTSADFQSRRGFWLGYDNSLDLYASTVIARDTLSTLTAVDPCLPATPSQSVESQNYNGPKTLKRKASRHQVEDLTHHNEIPKSMCLIFRVSGPAFTKNKRVRTEETRHIKAIGACLRCHLLKRRVSTSLYVTRMALTLTAQVFRRYTLPSV